MNAQEFGCDDRMIVTAVFIFLKGSFFFLFSSVPPAGYCCPSGGMKM
jgi:hypothetical protein